MDFDIPYKDNPSIIYEILDIDSFISTFKGICFVELLKNKNLNTVRKLDNFKYTDSYLKKLLKDDDILKTVNIYITKNEKNNLLVNSSLYRKSIQEHMSYIYFKFLNIIVDDGHMFMYFDVKLDRFAWKIIKNKK